MTTRLAPRAASGEATPVARTERGVAAKVLIAAGIIAAFAAVWRTADVLLIGFGGLLLGVALRALAALLERRARVPGAMALPAAIVLVLAAIGAVLWFVGDTLVKEFGQLAAQLPTTLAKLREWLSQYAAGRVLLDAIGSVDGAESVSRLAGAAVVTLSAVAHALALVMLGIYFAVDPFWYRRGTLRLVPPAYRGRVGSTLSAAAEALRKWLGGVVVAMLVVGCLTGLGLWALGVQFAFTLAVIAAALEFVPFLGPIVAAIPAVLVGFGESPTTALYVALLYLAIQQIEGYLLTPLVQRWAVSLPPALAVLAVLAFGVLFGLPGVLFAVPLLVVAIVVVRKLYIEPLET
jgi:predicted PurR-regulated permease PerM